MFSFGRYNFEISEMGIRELQKRARAVEKGSYHGKGGKCWWGERGGFTLQPFDWGNDWVHGCDIVKNDVVS